MVEWAETMYVSTYEVLQEETNRIFRVVGIRSLVQTSYYPSLLYYQFRPSVTCLTTIFDSLIC